MGVIMHTWQLQKAKAHLSEVVRLSIMEGPNFLLLEEKMRRICFLERIMIGVGSKPSFLEFMSNSSLKGLDIVFERDKSKIRDIDLRNIY
jgi:hypothetical protein